MNLVRRTAANTGWLLAGQIIVRASGLLVAVLLTRYLGAEGFGRYAFVCAYVGFFVFLTDMGMDLYITREASCDLAGSEDLTGKAIVTKIFLSLLAFSASVTVALLAGLGRENLTLIAIASTGLLLAPLTLYTAAFSATLQFHYTAIFEVFGRVLLIGFLLVVMFLKGSLSAIFVALVLPGAVVACLNVLYGGRLFRPRLALDWEGSRQLLARAFPIALGLFCIQVLMRIDQVMLEWLRGDQELGLYSVGVKCCEALHVIPAILAASVFPILSRTARAGQEEEFLKICSVCFKSLSLVLFPAALALFLYPGQILSFLFGRDFAAGAPVLRILCWSTPLISMGYILMCAAISANHLRAMLHLSLWLAVSNIALNLLLIPRTAWPGGGTGAALATVLSLAGLLVLALLHASLRPVAGEFLRRSLKPAASVLPPALVLSCVALPAPAGIPLAAALYAALILLLKGVDKEDLNLVRKVIRRD